MTEGFIDKSINKFILEFNNICISKRKDFLLRERASTYEGRTTVKKYKVIYKVEKKTSRWDIYAESKTLFIFKKKFPLFRILNNDGMIMFEGLFTKNFKPFKAQDIDTYLNQYIENCMNKPHNAFINI